MKLCDGRLGANASAENAMAATRRRANDFENMLAMMVLELRRGLVEVDGFKIECFLHKAL